LSFCFVNYEQGAIPFQKYLEIKNWKQENCGLVNIQHMKDVFGLYYSETEKFNGIIRGADSNDVCLSSIPKGRKQETLLYFNMNGYSTYCREYREYWDWVEKRNDARYENTQSHGKNYDAKNMMHVFRLLDMAIEIGKEKKVNVKRPNRDFLLEIKTGKFEYDDLLKMADDKQKEMEFAFMNSDLPDQPDTDMLNDLTYRIRDKFYKDKE
jgi:uncharacterized protein